MQDDSRLRQIPSMSPSYPIRGHEGTVLKVSNGKCFMNRRYLVIRDGKVQYYRNKPSDSTGSSRPKAHMDILKCNIDLVNQEFCKKKKQPFMFQISFLDENKRNKRTY